MKAPKQIADSSVGVSPLSLTVSLRGFSEQVMNSELYDTLKRYGEGEDKSEKNNDKTDNSESASSQYKQCRTYDVV